MKKFLHKNNNMKRIILIFLGLFSLSYAQYSPTGAKTQFKNGLGLGSKDSSAFLANDSLAITIDRNNRLLWRNNGSNGTWNVVAKVGVGDFIINQLGSNLSAQTAKFRITDTGWINNVLRTNKALLDSIQASSSAGGYLVTNGGSAVMHWGGGGSVEVDFKGFAGYDANRSSSYTVRSFTDKRYVDSADALRLLISDTSTLLSQVVRTFGNQTISGKKTFTDSIVGANARITGTINATGQITSLSPIVSTDRGNGTTAFQSELSTSALNDSLIVMLGRSANGTYNLMELTQYQRVANQSTGGVALNIFDNGGRVRVQNWERDSIVMNRPLIVRGQTTIRSNGVPLMVNSLNSNTNKITFQDNGTDRGSIGASSTDAFVVANSSGTAVVNITNSNGNVGIGESSPGQRLVVRRTGASNYLIVSGENNASYDIATNYTDGTNNVFAGMLRGSGGGTGAYNVITGGSIRFTINSSGDATFSGSVTATGFIVSSDKRLKKIITRDGDMVKYVLKSDPLRKVRIGYIAQEVEKYLPETVSENEKGEKAVNYIEVLVYKVRQLEKEITKLKKQINEKTTRKR